MKHALIPSLWLLTLALCGCPNEAQPPEPRGGEVLIDSPPEPPKTAPSDADRQALAAGNSAFALDLYKHVGKDEQGNLFLSPYSITTALAMTYGGARGDTAKQMAGTLHFDLPPDRLHVAFQDLLAAQLRAKKEGYRISLANRLWGQKGYGFQDPYLKLIHEHYGARLVDVDFQSDPDAAAEEINRWVEKQTKERIKELIGEGVLNADTRLVLTNAIHFEAKWQSEFESKDTWKQDFHRTPTESSKVDFMHQKHAFRYVETPDVQVIELPYRGAASMIIVLPRKKDGLAAVEKTLTSEQLTAWLAKLERQNVKVALPKFEMTSRFELSKALRELGMPLAFGDDADFSGINGKQDLKIQKVIHQAFVRVDEEGTEAAAATAVALGEKAARPRPTPEFTADHPFLFVIRDDTTETILFMGRVADPRS